MSDQELLEPFLLRCGYDGAWRTSGIWPNAKVTTIKVSEYRGLSVNADRRLTIGTRNITRNGTSTVNLTLPGSDKDILITDINFPLNYGTLYVVWNFSNPGVCKSLEDRSLELILQIQVWVSYPDKI